MRMNEELKNDEKLYNIIFDRIEHLLRNGAAVDAYWGIDVNGDHVANPYDPDLQLYSLHGAATVASIETLYMLRFLACGMLDKEIIKSTHMNQKMVDEYVKCIIRVLGVKDRAQASLWAGRQSYVQQKDFWTHRCTSMAERFYLEKYE